MASDLAGQFAQFQGLSIEDKDLRVFAVRVGDILTIEGNLIDTEVTAFLDAEDFFTSVSREELEVLVVRVFEEHKTGSMLHG